MTPQQWQRIEELFEAAVEVPNNERAAFLERRCPGDPDLQRELRRLVQHHETAGNFMRQPLVQTASLAEGQVIAQRYRIISLIGRGGMGEVYQAEDQLLRETIALKKLRSDLASNDTIVRQFQKEIQLARKITHQNICRVFEVGAHQPHDGGESKVLFFTMELLDGETLSSKIRREGKLSRETAFPIAIQIADGLSAAHRAGVVHTDFKSGNIILVSSPGGEERAVITDFGLARRDPSMLAPETTRSMIDDGRIAGTVAYMSPEQLQGGTITAASDIYSFGIVLFEMATGQLPFDDRRVIHSAMQRADPQTVSVRALVSDIDRRWEQAILRCLQKNPENRFRSASELGFYLRTGPWASPRLWSRREWTTVVSVAAISVASGGGVWFWARRPYQPTASALDWYRKGQKAMHSMTYEAARRSLSQAVAADPMFAIAYAALARTYDELDYSDRAKDLMLQAVSVAREKRLSATDDLRLTALQYMVSRDYDRAAPLVRQLEDESDSQDRAPGALESGWLAQQREDTEAAQAAYERALKLDPNYAAAKLRLGFILGRRGGKDDQALQAFSEAESLFSAESDYEGITETLLQRANLLNRRSRAPEAIPIIERALSAARTVGNRYQEIRLLQLQGVALRNLGQSARAGEIAQQAIDAAVAENMDNLASSGLLDLGNVYLVAGDPKAAEPIFHRALDLARRGKVRRIEARAKTSLISVCEQDHRPEEAKKFAEDVLSFYRQAGYRRELVQTMGILAGVHEQLGEYEEGIRVSREALAGTVELQDRRSEALVRERLAQNLKSSGAWPEALQEHLRAADLLGPPTGIPGSDDRLACAQLFWWLGRTQDSLQFLEQVQKTLAKEKNNKLQAALHARKAEMAYDDGHWGEALTQAGQGLSIDSRGDEADRDLQMFQGLALIRSGHGSEGADLSSNLVRKLEQEKLVGSAAAARLAIAEAWVAVGVRRMALGLLGDALNFFESHQVFESLWRAHALTGTASEDPQLAETHRNKATMVLSQLKARWSAENFAGYMRRPSIRQLSEQKG
jgi:serine/threonine protein kinase